MERLKVLWKRGSNFFRSLSDQTKLTLVVSLLVGIGLATEWAAKLGAVPQSIKDPRLLMAIRDLDKGTVLTQLDLTTVLASPGEADTVFNDQQLPIVLGSKLKFKLKRGERIAHDVLELPGPRKSISERIPAGLRAYSFRPENELPLQLGDTIDLISVPQQGVPRSVIAGAEVLDLKRIDSGQTVIVAVSEDDLPELEKARQTGKLVMALRGQEEKTGQKKLTKRRSKLKKSNGSIQMLVEESE